MDRHRQSGFTLVEVAVASAILVSVVTLAGAGLMYFLRGVNLSQVQTDLDIDVQTSMERLKYDLRLSSLDEMFFYPQGAPPYTGLSLPLARDDNGDGVLDLDAQGRIIWDRTLVYHVWSGNPNQLRVTIFDPRDTGMADEVRQQQLDSVVVNGNGNSAPNHANATTEVVFQNLFTWSIRPRGAIYDAYAPTLTRDVDVTMGSCVIGTGSHAFKFSVIGKNAASSGYKVGVDTMLVSPCYGSREAEAQLPVAAESGGTAAMQYMAGGSWSGNYHLLFPASGVGDYFSLSMANDRWEETNFNNTGDVHDNTTVEFSLSFSPYDFVASLDSLGYKWRVTEQTGDTIGSHESDAVRGCAVRMIMRGDEMLNGGWIESDGGSCHVLFRAGPTVADKLKILAAYIGECSTNGIPSMDVKPGTQHALTFAGVGDVTISGGALWSDLASFPIEKEKSYVVSYLVDGSAAHGNAWKWSETIDPTMQACYVIPAASAPSAADVAADVWSARGDVVSTNCVLGVQLLWTTYPTNGTYISHIIDTHVDSPNYDRIDWNEYVPAGADLTLKVRSGDSNDLADAAAWTNIAAMASPGAINPGSGRYLQFRSDFRPGNGYYSTPQLKDVTINWVGAEQVVDVGGTFTKGPDYGIFEILVDGQRLKTGIVVDLEIFRDVRGYRGSQRITSALTTEVTPRNTGK